MTKYSVREELSANMDAYKAKLFDEAEKIVQEEFLMKVVQLNELLESKRYSYERIGEIVAEFGEMKISLPTISAENVCAPPEKKNIAMTDTGKDIANGSSVNGFSNETVPCNAKLEELMDELRPILLKAIDDVNKVKMWIMLLVPKIEDGNNFGVAVQEGILREVKSVENEAAAYLDQTGRYFAIRAKLLTKVAKYPNLADYRRTVMDCDESQFINVRMMIQEMRNHFASLYDLITKNIEKIRRPRSSTNLDHMY